MRIASPGRNAALTLSLTLLLAMPLSAQTPEGVRVVPDPVTLTMVAGDEAPISASVVDADGTSLDVPVRFAAPRGSLQVRGGTIRALRAGTFEVVAIAAVPAEWGIEAPSATIPVTVTWPAIETIDITSHGGSLYASTLLRHSAVAVHTDETLRPDPRFTWESSDPSIATVDRFGTVTAVAPGNVRIRASLDGAVGEVSYDVRPFPATELSIRGGEDQVRTGDVLNFEAIATSDGGSTVSDIPIEWSYTFVPDDSIEAPGAAGIVENGHFVGAVPGQYTILALAGPLTARQVVDVRPREVVQQVEFIGKGLVSEYRTSDLWVFEGVDGGDYAVTGTWGADGWAYFWDVTDPTNIMKTDSIQLDARTVNDVKVSPDGRYAALSREGASNRVNGLVIVDLADPRNPVVAATYDEGLTGGVHNMFAMDDYLFALSGGDKYVILDMSDIANPRYVSEYNHPDSRIHDVWVHDGIAYSSEWGTGVVIVDVGNGRWGGTIENPVFVTNVPYPVGRTHAAFPYYQESTGKFYLFLGDEIIGRGGAAWGGGGLSDIPADGNKVETGDMTSGYIHIIDFTDPENPKDVARYQVPEFGTHNLWVEDDKLYVSYYEGGTRVVDVSGELMGNLADQGREIAVFKAYDSEGFIPNVPYSWGPQPYKGNLFMSDFHSGLWVVRLLPPLKPVS